MQVDLAFAVMGAGTVPADHGYVLYSALSRALPALHRENGVAVHPIRGRQAGERQMLLAPWSRLTLRLEAERIADVLPLAGKQLTIAGRPLRVGVPQVHALTPAAALRSRLVTIKKFFDPEPFLDAVRRQLDALGVSEQVQITLGRRRTLRIKDKEVVGFEVVLEGLLAEESLAVQEQGIGGRRHMGCGVFVPTQSTRLSHES